MAQAATASSGSSNGNESGSEELVERPKGTSWLDVAWLMLSDVVGTSVLTFAGVARVLGSVLTVVFIAGLFPLSLYVSVRMSNTRSLVLKTARLHKPGSEAALRVDTMGEIAAHLMGSARAGHAVYLAVYGYTLLGQASYLLVLGTSLQSALFTERVCIYTAVALGCAALFVPVVAIRKLGESVWLCLANTILLVTLVVMALASIAHRGRPECAPEPALFAPGLTLLGALGAATNVVYSYAGQWMYFELMETMTAPHEFPRAFAVTGPVMVVVYLAVALIAHHYAVQQDDLMQNVPRGSLLRAAAAMLFVHVMVVYLIKSIVLQQYFHRLCSPADVDRRTAASFVKHGLWGTAMLLFGFVVANSVPFFWQLLGIIGGLLGGPINFLFPLVLYVLALGRYTVASSEADEPSSVEDSDEQAAAVSPAGALGRGLRQLPRGELALLAATFLFIGATMVLGVADVVRQVVELDGRYGLPFTCHALPPPSEGKAAMGGNSSSVCR